MGPGTRAYSPCVFPKHTPAERTPMEIHGGSGRKWRQGCGYLLAWLILMAGCAPKEVPVPEPAPVSPPKPSVSSILMQQYRAWKGVPYRLGGTSKKELIALALCRLCFGMDLALNCRARQWNKARWASLFPDWKSGQGICFFQHPKNRSYWRGHGCPAFFAGINITRRYYHRT